VNQRFGEPEVHWGKFLILHGPVTGLNAIAGKGVIKHKNNVYAPDVAVHLAGQRAVAAPGEGRLFDPRGDFIMILCVFYC
jgi:hypothetical protein